MGRDIKPEREFAIDEVQLIEEYMNKKRERDREREKERWI